MKSIKGLIPSVFVSCCACFAFIAWGYGIAHSAKGNVDWQNDFIYLYHPMVGPLIAWFVFLLSSAAKKFWIHGIDEWQNNARALYIYCGLLTSVGGWLLWEMLHGRSIAPLLIYLALTMNLAGYYWGNRGVVPTEDSGQDEK